MSTGLVFGGASTAATFVIAGFWKYEDVASPEVRSTITNWLNYRGGPSSAIPSWPQHLVTAFNTVFGERHLSLKCVIRSCIASLLAMSTMIFIWWLLRPNEFLAFIQNPKHTVLAVFFFILPFNFIPDYLSYMKTRIILASMAKSRGFSQLWQFVAVDTLLTLFIFGFFSVVLLSQEYAIVHHTTFSFQDWWRHGLIGFWSQHYVELITLHASGRGAFPFGVVFYAAFFVSAWTWLYAVSALFTRFALEHFPGFLARTVWLFDVNSHPVRTLGCISGTLVFVFSIAGIELTRL
jgi:hypothetical protein